MNEAEWESVLSTENVLPAGMIARKKAIGLAD